jgi:hypothetical protein
VLTDDLVLDTSVGPLMHLTFLVDNRLSEPVTPASISMRWECGDLGFSTFLVPLSTFEALDVAPCIYPRPSWNDSSFLFVSVPVEAAEIPARGRGSLRFEAISATRSHALDDLVAAGIAADMCCRSPGSECDGHDLTAPGCSETNAFFMKNGLGMSVSSGQPGAASRDLLMLRDLAQFDSAYYDGVLGSRAPQYGARYPMRLHTRVEARTAGGQSVESADFAPIVHFCKGCGLRDSASMARAPFVRPECMQ